jgi:hypothetical protein
MSRRVLSLVALVVLVGAGCGHSSAPGGAGGSDETGGSGGSDEGTGGKAATGGAVGTGGSAGRHRRRPGRHRWQG